MSTSRPRRHSVATSADACSPPPSRSMYADDETRLRHMLDGAREAIAIAGRRARDDPQSDRVLALALVKLIEIVGEAAARVTRQFQEAQSATLSPATRLTGIPADRPRRRPERPAR